MNEEVKEVDSSGPISCANWKAFEKGEPLRAIVEYPLYTDARVIGEISEGYGPYRFLNTVPGDDRPGLLKPSIILRVEFHLGNDLPQMNETDISNYHGGWFPDEIAALVSLCLGIRVKAADESRRFDQGGDPLGRPQAFRFRREPTMSLDDRRLKLPNAVGAHSLEDLTPIKYLPNLSGEEAIVVIRAARLYQDALWIGESEPALSWLMLVSALEAGANMWHQGDDSPVSKLEASKPNLYNLLESTGVEGLTENVANEIVHTLGATNKFIKFVLEYLPEPPEKRPLQWGQIPWSRTFMRSALGKIYGYRSNALHGGIPFPAPMCNDGMIVENCMAEKPTGLACSTLGGVWLAEDTPMLLHMFEYIARGTLINWIKSLENA
ncbi:hypothetical protein L1D29_02950 [Shewanella insulae]|uniref:hypothetical protein n=1 Tax=Shewanella insulae TaxID=2681496 RepID=UPI001EFD8E06|nr:hypothetical protein [Shewanella insulae]MCG9711776.1 hypothetical protein [Shewanella insulae]